MVRALLLLPLVSLFGSSDDGGRVFPGDRVVQDALPEVNQRIVDYVRGQMGKQVGRGECWDLAAEALNAGGAAWDGFYGYGTLLDWKKEKVLPGDIVQFENVVVVHRTDTSVWRDTFSKHTAIVIEVKERGVYTLAHQNYNEVRVVRTIPMRMADVRGGELKFFRPHGGRSLSR